MTNDERVVLITNDIKYFLECYSITLDVNSLKKINLLIESEIKYITARSKNG